ncbi:PD-(D/E)XK nuclease family protein [Synechococcus sp. Nb3U1]|uniref:PD-(D/E)XK nuclease family protein n=1 Tax=Synechococcus sp. Nb3U1 TaxID=1914529 RepID=UPI001F341856|nr:PD-(D/E)XK nuclease family protein [Synechococcus sp. Nb3U1]MCF2970568.1 PD-(D/E)XK nuclease family protein [Synechococcus sp. Nb3U1]
MSGIPAAPSPVPPRSLEGLDLEQINLSASSLALLEHCPRLFRYVYLEQLIWPSADAFEHELERQHGQQFHRLVELHSQGREVEPRLPSLDEEVQQWWRVFLASPHAHPQGRVFAELPLWQRIEGFKLIARLDQLVIAPASLQIVDWKTERQRPLDSHLRKNWQVRLYPLLLCGVAEQLPLESPFRPEQVQLTLWYAQHPQQPFHLHYSATAYEQDLAHLKATLTHLRQLEAQNFPMTPHTERCGSCLFRSRCYGLLPEGIPAEDLLDWVWPTEEPQQADPQVD